ncbi:MAG: LysE family transporter [Thermosediminibacteraceae bacterium]|nr:LysE family transporter [Thermosediminibacteraceae bacterium]
MPNFAAFLSYAFVTTFTPGPNNILSMTFGTRLGFKKALKFISGVTTGFAIVMTLCSYFNLLLFTMIPQFEGFMKLLGAIYIVYLAVKILKSSPEETDSPVDKNNTFAVGLLLQFFNPKVILYGITVTSNFITPYYKAGMITFIFSLFLAFLSFLSTCSWALFGAAFQKFLKKHKNAFNIVMALLLLYCAFSILCS